MSKLERSAGRNGGGFSIPWWVAAGLFAIIAIFLLWEEHEAHILGVLPWLILAACPLIHLFMHKGHGHGDGDGHSGGKHCDHESHGRPGGEP